MMHRLSRLIRVLALLTIFTKTFISILVYLCIPFQWLLLITMIIILCYSACTLHIDRYVSVTSFYVIDFQWNFTSLFHFFPTAGHETKSMLNNNRPRYKRSKLERKMNKDVLLCVLLLFCMCLIGAMGKWGGGGRLHQHAVHIDH